MRGTTPSASLLARVRRGEIGGVILFGSNITGPAQLRRLTARLQAEARAGGRPPLLIATDQEGGGVRRLPWAGPALSATALGRTSSADCAARGPRRRQGAPRSRGERRPRARRRRSRSRLVHGCRPAHLLVRREGGRLARGCLRRRAARRACRRDGEALPRHRPGPAKHRSRGRHDLRRSAGTGTRSRPLPHADRGRGCRS